MHQLYVVCDKTKTKSTKIVGNTSLCTLNSDLCDVIVQVVTRERSGAPPVHPHSPAQYSLVLLSPSHHPDRIMCESRMWMSV